MDSSTILIASFMIFSIGRTTVSGLNFDPYFFLHIVKGSKARFLLPLLIDQGPPAVVSLIHITSPTTSMQVTHNPTKKRNTSPRTLVRTPTTSGVGACWSPRHSCNRH